MAQNNKAQKKNQKKSGQYRPAGAWLWPIALALAVIPLFVHTWTYDTGLTQYDWYPDGAGEQTDFFLFYKMIAVIVATVIMLCLLLYRLSKDRKNMPWEKPFFLMVGYSVLCFLSFLFSKNKAFAAGGGYEIFEPVWVILGYVIIMYYCYATVRDEQDIIKIFAWAAIGIGIVYIIGLFQFGGLDFFKSDFGKRLMLDDVYWANKDSISFTFPDFYIYTTLYNINFVCLYVGGLLPVFVTLAFVDKKVWRKFIWGAFSLASPIMLYGSHTDSGYVAVVVGIGVALLVFASRKKITGIIAGGVAVLAVVGGVVFLFSPAADGLRSNEWLFGNFYLDDVYPLTSVLTKDEGVELKTNNDTIVVTIDVTSLGVVDGEGQPVTATLSDTEPGLYTISGAGDFDGTTIQMAAQENVDENTGETSLFTAATVNFYDKEWIFSNSLGDGSYWYYNQVGKWTKITGRVYERVFPEYFLSGRGVIWNHAIPILKECIFIGKGANNYMVAYPQDDYIAETYFDSLTTYDVKGHSWLFHTAIEEGILAVILFLAFYIWYCVRAIIIFRRGSLKDPSTWLVFAFFIGTVIYMTAALANDSTVCTGIVMWVDLGMGLAANRIAAVKQKKCLEEEQSN